MPRIETDNLLVSLGDLRRGMWGTSRKGGPLCRIVVAVSLLALNGCDVLTSAVQSETEATRVVTVSDLPIRKPEADFLVRLQGSWVGDMTLQDSTIITGTGFWEQYAKAESRESSGRIVLQLVQSQTDTGADVTGGFNVVVFVCDPCGAAHGLPSQPDFSVADTATAIATVAFSWARNHGFRGTQPFGMIPIIDTVDPIYCPADGMDVSHTAYRLTPLETGHLQVTGGAECGYSGSDDRGEWSVRYRSRIDAVLAPSYPEVWSGYYDVAYRLGDHSGNAVLSVLHWGDHRDVFLSGEAFVPWCNVPVGFSWGARIERADGGEMAKSAHASEPSSEHAGPFYVRCEKLPEGGRADYPCTGTGDIAFSSHDRSMTTHSTYDCGELGTLEIRAVDAVVGTHSTPQKWLPAAVAPLGAYQPFNGTQLPKSR